MSTNPVKAVIHEPLQSPLLQKDSNKNLSTESCFCWLHAKNVEFKNNIRGMVNYEYNRLLEQKGLILHLIPGGENLNELDVDKTTSIVRPDLYFQACQTAMSNFTSDPFSGLVISTDVFFDLFHNENLKHKANIRGLVNQNYNKLASEEKIPGDGDLERLGMDRKTPLKLDLYLKAYREVIAQYEQPPVTPKKAVSVDYQGKYFNAEQLAARNSCQAFAKIHLLEPHNLFFVVVCMADGWGDLGNALNAVRLVKEEYPAWNMRLLIHILHPFGTPIPFDIEQSCGLKPEEYLVVYREHNGRYDLQEKPLLPDPDTKKESVQYSSDLSLPRLIEKINKFKICINTADLQIAISTSLPFRGGVNLSAPKFIQFREYSKGNDSDSAQSIMHMGVSPSCAGIYILDSVAPNCFSDPILKGFFEKHKNVYFNYGSEIIEYISWVDLFYKDSLELNIITNASSEELSKDAGRILTETEAQKVVLVKKNGEEEVIAESEIPGKIIRLFNPFPLIQGDMKLAMHLSKEPLGNKGNCSFSESLDRLPFYNLPECSIPFWEGLIKLAKSATPHSAKLIVYLQQILDEKQQIPERNKKGAILQTNDLPLLKEQWNELVEVLRQDWNVKDSYIGEINNRLISYENALELGLEQHFKNEAFLALWESGIQGKSFAPKLHTLNEKKAWLKENAHELKNISWLEIKSLRMKMMMIPDEIAMFSNLKSLYLQNTRISKIPDFLTLCSELNYISLYGGKISKIPDSLFNCPSLTRLDLSRNQIKEIPDSILNCSSLTDLDLGGNQIKKIPDSLSNCSSLTDLDLSGNQIQEIPDFLSSSSSLTVLNLSGNQIREMPDSISNFPSLIKLDLSGNHISELNNSVFKIKTLQQLKLENNKFPFLVEKTSSILQVTL